MIVRPTESAIFLGRIRFGEADWDVFLLVVYRPMGSALELWSYEGNYELLGTCLLARSQKTGQWVKGPERAPKKRTLWEGINRLLEGSQYSLARDGSAVNVSSPDGEKWTVELLGGG